MITVSSNNQTIGVILYFMRHLLIGFVCEQTDMYTVYIDEGRYATAFLSVQRSHGLFGVAISLGRSGGERRVDAGEVF
jgi:hypothetical protein